MIFIGSYPSARALRGGCRLAQAVARYRLRGPRRVYDDPMMGLPEPLLAGAKSLVVVAPHPDDDVLGCGALLARLAPRLRVSVVYVTDGAASHLGSAAYPPDRLRAVREREARRGLARLGVTSEPRFLRWPDGTVPCDTDAAAGPLLAALRACIPAGGGVAVALPWRRDPHADHRAVASLVRAVLRERPRATMLEYAVWLGVLGTPADMPRPDEGRTVAVESEPWLAAKRAALAEHRSQLGRLITDARISFALPAELLAAALGPVERFVIPVSA